MKRRSFLAGLLSVPALPFLGSFKTSAAGAGAAVTDAMTEALVAAAERAVNPPVLVDAAGNITPLFAGQYREEFIAQFENHRSLLREVMGRANT